MKLVFALYQDQDSVRKRANTIIASRACALV